MKKNYPLSEHYDGKKFSYPGLDMDKSFLDLLKWQIAATKAKWPQQVINTHESNLSSSLNKTDIQITYINHSTFLIQTDVINILTDPVWSERVSPFKFVGPKRVRKPGLEFKKLPNIDLVLVSHNHYDHMDIETLKNIYKNNLDAVFIVPLKNSQYLNFVNPSQIIELDWWQSVNIKQQNITLTPAQHWSARGLFDKRNALWGSFVVQLNNQRKLFFTGDSGYDQNLFSTIGSKFSPIDLALIPIGAYEPRWFMKKAHMNPEEAVLTHCDLNSKQSVAMHFGTFQLTDEDLNQPVVDLNSALNKYNVKKFDILNVGETKIY